MRVPGQRHGALAMLYNRAPLGFASSPVTFLCAAMKLVVKVFAEITIKSRPVRQQFIRQLAKNLRTVLKDLAPDLKVSGSWDKLEIDSASTDPRVRQKMLERLVCTPGIAHVLEVDAYPLGDFDSILAHCQRHFGALLPGKTFAVRVKRVGHHDFDSMELTRFLGGHLASEYATAGVSLSHSEVEVRLEIREQQLFVIHGRHGGIGGYPLGSLEQSLALISGGFDSSVAAYQIMRRGLMTHFCFFSLGGRAQELGVMEVAHYLWQKFGSSHRVLFITVPFEEVVGEILEKVTDSYMAVVLKRMMLRAASQIAESLHINALVTGESLSQVASQTLQNLSVIDSATDLLVLRPLIASHKQDIINTAEAIGTAEFAMHMPEYCGVVSQGPTTRARDYRVEHEEAQFDPAVLERALAGARRVAIDRVMEALGEQLEVEEVDHILPGQIVLDIRHPNSVEEHPLQLPEVEVKHLPFYALNSQFKDLDANRQYLLYCDKGVMSRLHAAHLMAEGHRNVRVYRPGLRLPSNH